MAFNVSLISPYTNETAQGLIRKAVLTGNTFDLVTVVPGVKYKEALNIMSNTVTVAAASCGWTPAGNVAFTQRDIEVVALEVKDALCEKTLEKYWMGQMMKPGAPKDEELGAVLADSYVEGVKVKNEHLVWQGSKSQSPADLVDGFLAVLQGEAYVPCSAAATNTASDIIAHVNLMIAAAPEVLSTLPDLTMFMSIANFRMYVQAIADKNYFAVPANVGTELSFTNPLNGVRFVGVAGLSGSTKLVLTYAANLVIGTDLVNEEEKFDIWYSRDNDEVRVNIQYKLGTQIQFPELVVYNQA